MDIKINVQLHAKIRELFPLEMGKSTVIEILSVEPLRYDAKTYTNIDDASEHAISLAHDEKPYFVIDSLSREVPIFLYKDIYISLVKDYLTNKILRYVTTDPDFKYNEADVIEELKQLMSLLDPKAS